METFGSNEEYAPTYVPMAVRQDGHARQLVTQIKHQLTALRKLVLWARKSRFDRVMTLGQKQELLTEIKEYQEQIDHINNYFSKALVQDKELLALLTNTEAERLVWVTHPKLKRFNLV